jgi:hypothetical protein
MLTPEQAELVRIYPAPEICGSQHPEDPKLTCNLSPHGKDAMHYAHGVTWPVTS